MVTNLNLCGYSKDVDPHDSDFQNNEYAKVKDPNCAEYPSKLTTISIGDEFLFSKDLLKLKPGPLGHNPELRTRVLETPTDRIGGFKFSQEITSFSSVKYGFYQIARTEPLFCEEATSEVLSQRLKEGTLGTSQFANGVLLGTNSGDFYLLLNTTSGIVNFEETFVKHPEMIQQALTDPNQLVYLDGKPKAFGFGSCIE